MDTSLTATISHHRPEDEHAILALLDEHACEPSSTNDRLIEGRAYGAYDVPESAADDLAGDLIRVAPFTSFEVFTEPSCGLPGHLVRYAPIRGRVDLECDEMGHVLGEDDLPLVANG